MSTSKMDSDHSVTDLVIDTDLDNDMDASITQPSVIQSSKKCARKSLGDAPILAASLTTDPAITIKPLKKKKKNKGKARQTKDPSLDIPSPVISPLTAVAGISSWLSVSDLVQFKASLTPIKHVPSKQFINVSLLLHADN
jgi:hypothetical protein